MSIPLRDTFSRDSFLSEANAFGVKMLVLTVKRDPSKKRNVASCSYRKAGAESTFVLRQEDEASVNPITTF